MLKKATPVLAILLLLSLFWLQNRVPLTFAQTSTPTPPAEEAADAESTDAEALMAQIDDLEARLASLEEMLGEAEEIDAEPLPIDWVNEVTVAIYLMDNAGLHDLDVNLNEEGEIMPYDAGRVARLARLLSTVHWPEAMAADAEALIDVLNELSAALADDELETAAPLATQVHDDGHELSHAAEHWLGEMMAMGEATDTNAQAFRVTAAIYLMDNAGLHDLDVRLNEEGEIMPYDAGRVARLARLLSTVDWPDDLAEDAEALIDMLNELAAALADDDLETAAPLATQVHDEGHDLSHAAEYLAGGEDDHGDEQGETEEDGAEEKDEDSSSTSGG